MRPCNPRWIHSTAQWELHVQRREASKRRSARLTFLWHEWVRHTGNHTLFKDA